MVFGYARVSTGDQNLSTQIKQLNDFGVDEIYKEKVSGRTKNKEQLDILLRKLGENDTLVITRMDRLGRATTELLSLVDELQKRKINIVVINLGIDTRTPTGKFFLTVMSGLAELEYQVNREKQLAGIAIAKKNGLYKGRKRKYTLNSPNVKHAIELYEQGNESVNQIAKKTGISEATLRRRIKEYKNKT